MNDNEGFAERSIVGFVPGKSPVDFNESFPDGKSLEYTIWSKSERSGAEGKIAGALGLTILPAALFLASSIS